MKRLFFSGIVILVVVIAAGALVFRGKGVSARRQPFPGEERLARAGWRFMVPAGMRTAANPAPDTPETLTAALEHFADHCAICHGNDGSGRTTIGRSLYPPAPDLRDRRSQELTDGELFYAIEQGIPWTGMPAWGSESLNGQDESWKLVRFIRHLPKITPDELKRMEALNPRSPSDEKGTPAKTKKHPHKLP